ncbi:glycosyltransferase family 2 protein [Raineyella sp.]|uniref:Glycosyltransferase 2-like domain-containing protein n=1 Tax=bioreactor metagenome TaxID=1076179 RepID=A0A645A794_9ZZZZ|nr:glycosyltransferase [Raineyella sp.]MEA5153889.1 glycosyltransferase [Raineyella sp.]
MAEKPEPAAPLSAAVVIATYNRPDRVRDCLDHLARQSTAPDRVIVVDSSPDARTERVVRDFPGVLYARNPMGRGRTPESRQIGYSMTREDIVAFLDDDANAWPDWLEQLLARYDSPGIGGVGGSALNGVPGERQAGIGSIGLLLPDGRLTGNFAADPGHDVDVDHLLGANMSFRRSAIEEIGGIYGDYPGTCLREESDLALRIRARGHRLVYTPAAVVDHLPGEYAKGKRFDRRYVFYANRNSVVLLSRVYGTDAPVVRRFVVTAAREVIHDLRRAARGALAIREVGPRRAIRTVLGGLSRGGVVAAGVVAGFPAARRAVRRDRARQSAMRADA